MPEWLISLLIGGVIMSLVSIIYRGVMTKSEHAEACRGNSKELMKDVKDMVTERMDDLKEFMRKDVKVAILEEMRNGKPKSN